MSVEYLFPVDIHTLGIGTGVYQIDDGIDIDAVAERTHLHRIGLLGRAGIGLDKCVVENRIAQMLYGLHRGVAILITLAYRSAVFGNEFQRFGICVGDAVGTFAALETDFGAFVVAYCRVELRHGYDDDRELEGASFFLAFAHKVVVVGVEDGLRLIDAVGHGDIGAVLCVEPRVVAAGHGTYHGHLGLVTFVNHGVVVAQGKVDVTIGGAYGNVFLASVACHSVQVVGLVGVGDAVGKRTLGRNNGFRITYAVEGLQGAVHPRVDHIFGIHAVYGPTHQTGVTEVAVGHGTQIEAFLHHHGNRVGGIFLASTRAGEARGHIGGGLGGRNLKVVARIQTGALAQLLPSRVAGGVKYGEGGRVAGADGNGVLQDAGGTLEGYGIVLVYAATVGVPYLERVSVNKGTYSVGPSVEKGVVGGVTLHAAGTRKEVFIVVYVFVLETFHHYGGGGAVVETYAHILHIHLYHTAEHNGYGVVGNLAGASVETFGAHAEGGPALRRIEHATAGREVEATLVDIRQSGLAGPVAVEIPIEGVCLVVLGAVGRNRETAGRRALEDSVGDIDHRHGVYTHVDGIVVAAAVARAGDGEVVAVGAVHADRIVGEESQGVVGATGVAPLHGVVLEDIEGFDIGQQNRRGNLTNRSIGSDVGRKIFPRFVEDGLGAAVGATFGRGNPYAHHDTVCFGGQLGQEQTVGCGSVECGGLAGFIGHGVPVVGVVHKTALGKEQSRVETEGHGRGRTGYVVDDNHVGLGGESDVQRVFEFATQNRGGRYVIPTAVGYGEAPGGGGIVVGLQHGNVARSVAGAPRDGVVGGMDCRGGGLFHHEAGAIGAGTAHTYVGGALHLEGIDFTTQQEDFEAVGQRTFVVAVGGQVERNLAPCEIGHARSIGGMQDARVVEGTRARSAPHRESIDNGITLHGDAAALVAGVVETGPEPSVRLHGGLGHHDGAVLRLTAVLVADVDVVFGLVGQRFEDALGLPGGAVYAVFEGLFEPSLAAGGLVAFEPCRIGGARTSGVVAGAAGVNHGRGIDGGLYGVAVA